MSIKYSHAEDIQEKMLGIAKKLGISHDFSRVVCLRSHGSSSRRTLARCYAMPKVLQVALNMKAHYVIEVISERYDILDEKEKTKVIIHELMHIPKSFGGGFRFHDHVSSENVEEMYRRYAKN